MILDNGLLFGHPELALHIVISCNEKNKHKVLRNLFLAIWQQ